MDHPREDLWTLRGSQALAKLGGIKPEKAALGLPSTPKSFGMDGPVRSASRIPSLNPCRRKATANRAVTELFSYTALATSYSQHTIYALVFGFSNWRIIVGFIQHELLLFSELIILI